ncbi:MAG: beta-ketoacyl synthase N-terminal-like domain-containing protein [bacterium]
MGRKRVFVTGMGIFCPLGGEIKEFWNNLTQGKSGVLLCRRDIECLGHWVSYWFGSWVLPW